MMTSVMLFGVLLRAVSVAASVSFVTLGDWGGAALEEPSKPYAKNTRDVASALKTVFAKQNVQFLVNTGDNFYWCGIQNTSDFQVKADWVDTYADKVRAVNWYSVLGNHEYGYNVQAQIDLHAIYPTWIMDDRYYTRRVALSSSQSATMIFLDSSPCVSEYRASTRSRWDPCGTMYPTCSLSGGHDDFEGTCHFNQNILSQDCGKQLAWFKKELSAVPKDDWLLIIGHHPLDEIDVEDFVTPAASHGFDLYLNGHAHTLTHYMIDGSAKYVTSGAGALVMSYDQLGGSPAKDRTMRKATGGDMNGDGKLDEVELAGLAEMASVPYGNHSRNVGHTYKKVYNNKVSGFTLHTFSSDFKTLKTDFIGTDGSSMYSFTTTKGASPSPPSPSPGPSPSPSGGCCYYHDAACSAGQTCCSGSGRSYESASSCSHYGSKHGCTWDGSTCSIKQASTTVEELA